MFEEKIIDGVWLHNDDDLDLRLARFELLLKRRPELANCVLLRQISHNVKQWHKRVKLFESISTRLQILTYTEAVRTVYPVKAVGKPHALWVAFAKLYESHNDLAAARVIFDKAVQVCYKTVDHLASVWCEWTAMELRHNDSMKALDLMRRATAEPSVEVKRHAVDGHEPVQMKLHKSLKLWILYVELEKSFGNLDSTHAVYERILDLRIATPLTVINYATLLEEHKYFEDVFRVYQRGVNMFQYPDVKIICNKYVSRFVEIYGGAKLERARDLFEKAIGTAPLESMKPLCLKYAEFEGNYGSAKRALKIYNDAIKAVPAEEKLSICEIYIARAVEILGVPRTREIYEQAILSGLPDKDMKTLCLKYAELENSLGEINRARAIYIYASEYAHPTIDVDFWNKWHEFEVQHGKEETFKEKLPIRQTLAEPEEIHEEYVDMVEIDIPNVGFRGLAKKRKQMRGDDGEEASCINETEKY